MFTSPLSSSRIEIQGCVYSFETPDSQLRIKFFQSAVGKEVKNGIEFLKYLKPVRELLASTKINDIRQLVQRELDDVRIIKSLVPYLLNEQKIHGESGIAFFPSVLGVLMPKDYLNSLDKPYPTILIEKKIRGAGFETDFFESDGFNWSVKNYFAEDGSPLAYASLTIDKDNCDVVVIDGQHRVNAFRAACDALTTDNDIIKQIYTACSKYPDATNANLPITLLWFERKDGSSNTPIKSEIISRRLFIDVNNSAKSIAASRKILLDDRNPVNLLTNQFYSLIAEKHQFELNTLSLAQLGFDVPNEVSHQKDFSSMPFTYISTPERLKYIFHAFFVRGKSYSITTGKSSTDARKRKFSSSLLNDETKKEELCKMLPLTSDVCITVVPDEYEEKDLLFVSDDIQSSGKTKQEEVRDEFADQYFDCFYNLLSKFRYFNNYITNIESLSNDIYSGGQWKEIETWNSVFLEGKSIYYALKSKSQANNSFTGILNEIEEKFKKDFLNHNYAISSLKTNSIKIEFESGQLSEIELFSSFRTLAFQIGYFLAFYEYCRIVHSCDFSSVSKASLVEYADEYIEKVNNISNEEWANYFTFLRNLQGETHPKYFPVIMHLILRRIQDPATIFDFSDEKKYFSPECFYFHEKTILNINKIIYDTFGKAEIKLMTLNDLLITTTSSGKTFREVFDALIEQNKLDLQDYFNDKLKISTTYLEELFPRLRDEILNNLCVK